MRTLWKCLASGLIIFGSVQAMEVVDSFEKSLAQQGICVDKKEIYPGVDAHVVVPFSEGEKTETTLMKERLIQK